MANTVNSKNGKKRKVVLSRLIRPNFETDLCFEGLFKQLKSVNITLQHSKPAISELGAREYPSNCYGGGGSLSLIGYTPRLFGRGTLIATNMRIN